MSQEEFEQRIAGIPMLQPPPGLRAEILLAARRTTARPSTVPPSLTGFLRELLWPAPRAWAALGACWAITLVLNSLAPGPPSSQGTLSGMSSNTSTPSAILAEQRMLRAELLGIVQSSPNRKPAKPANPSVRPQGAIRGREVVC